MKDFKTKNGFFTGNVGMGTTNPDSKLHLEGANTVDARVTLEQTTANLKSEIQQGSTGFALSAVGNQPLLLQTNGAERLRITSDGKVGIGTTDPRHELHVFNNTTAPRIRLQCANSSNAAILFGDVDDDTEAGILWNAGEEKLLIRGYNNIDRIAIDNAGNVGIGTTTPNRLLDVQNSGGHAFVSIVGKNDSRAAILLGDTDSDGQGRIDYDNSDDHLHFSTAQTEAVRITSGGNVGIGSTNPFARLGVEIPTNTDLTTGLFVRNNSSHSGSGGSNVAAFHGISDYVMQVKCDGNVGIGTTDPSGTLHIKSSNAELIFAYASGGYGGTTSSEMAATYTEKLHIGSVNSSNNPQITATFLKDGKVGIGTTNPGPSLHVKSASNTQACRVYRPTSGGGATVFDVASNNSATNTVQFIVYDDGVTQNATGTISQISSDERLKENISDATPKLQNLLKLKVKNFNFSDDENKTKYIGFIAQEMEEVFPSLVMSKDTRKYDEDGNLLSGLEDSKSTKVSMDFAILTKAIQEQQAIIEDLKARIETLES